MIGPVLVLTPSFCRPCDSLLGDDAVAATKKRGAYAPLPVVASPPAPSAGAAGTAPPRPPPPRPALPGAVPAAHASPFGYDDDDDSLLIDDAEPGRSLT